MNLQALMLTKVYFSALARLGRCLVRIPSSFIMYCPQGFYLCTDMLCSKCTFLNPQWVGQTSAFLICLWIFSLSVSLAIIVFLNYCGYNLWLWESMINCLFNGMGERPCSHNLPPIHTFWKVTMDQSRWDIAAFVEDFCTTLFSPCLIVPRAC